MLNSAELDGWLHSNHGNVFHPLEVLSKIGQTYENSIQRYCKLEDKGHIISISYHNGNVDAVRLFFPKKKSIQDISRELKISERELINKVGVIGVNGGLREGAMGIELEIIQVLEKHRFIKRSKGMVYVGREGYKLLGNNGY